MKIIVKEKWTEYIKRLEKWSKKNLDEFDDDQNRDSK